jgi:hypothetical protein
MLLNRHMRLLLSARAGRVPPRPNRPVIFCQPLFPPARSMTGSRSSAPPARARPTRRRDSSSGCSKKARVSRSSIRSGCVGLRARADGSAPGYPVVVFGGRQADAPITAEMGAALGRMIACEVLVCVVDLSELGSNAARRRFMAAFSETLYEANEEPLHSGARRRGSVGAAAAVARSDRPPG